MHGLDHGLLKQAIEIVETALLRPEGDPHRGEVAVAGMANQALGALGQFLGVEIGATGHAARR